MTLAIHRSLSSRVGARPGCLASGVRIPAQRIVFPDADRVEILQHIGRCLKSGRVAPGENVEEFERAFARLTRARHAIAVSSGGGAIEVAMHLLGVRDKEVIVPTNTFLATAAGVILAGGKVRFADCSAGTFGVSLETIRRARTPETIGVAVVHIGGIVTPEIRAIRTYCQENKLWLFEDCAHAHGSSFGGIPAGRFGILGAYSFFATKTVTCGEGGMLITDDDDLAARARRFRDYGKGKQWVSLSTELGANRRMSEFCAIVGRVHLRRLPEFQADRERTAELYTRALRCAVPDAEPVLPAGPSSWYKYIVLLPVGVRRDRVRAALAARNVELAGGVYEVPLHRQPVFRGTSGNFPVADDVCGRHICLPIYPGMREEESMYVVEALRAAVRA